MNSTDTTTDTAHAVYCNGTCTPDEHGNCQTVTSYGDENSREDSGTFTAEVTYVPDAGVYLHLEADLYETWHVDALMAQLAEIRRQIEAQEANGI